MKKPCLYWGLIALLLMLLALGVVLLIAGIRMGPGPYFWDSSVHI